MIENGNSYRIISDQVGTPRMLVESKKGLVRKKFRYDEFGIPEDDRNEDESNGEIPFGFAGGLYDGDTGLVRFGARDYDPTIGRWLSKDPIGFNGGDTNLYRYVANPLFQRSCPIS